MENQWEALENYQKNLWCLQKVTDRLLGHMKGYDYSFKQDITDKRGNFSEEKLRALVEELLSGWEKKLYRADTDPATGENVAEPWLRERRELYSAYLYLAMRCSLVQGAFQARGGSEKERTDFSFLMEQARRLSRDWCVIEEPGQGKKNALFEGYDKYFGLHLYYPLVDPERQSDDFALTPLWKVPQDHLDLVTNEGNMKRMFIQHLHSGSPAVEVEPEAAAEPEPVVEEQAAEEYDDEDFTFPDDWGFTLSDDEDDLDYDPDYDLFKDLDRAGQADLWEEWAERDNNASLLRNIALSFKGGDEYLSACKRFVELFEQAGPEVLRGFYDDLDDIVSTFLVKRGVSILLDTDKTLNIYSRIFDGPYQQAKRYARGIQWKSM